MNTPRISVAEGGFKKVPEDYTYFIAEAGNNHNGSLEEAFRLIDIAVECGADAVKFQKRDVPSMLVKKYMDVPFNIQGAGEEWGNTYRAVREHIELDMVEMKAVKDYCKGKIDFVVTPFDLKSFDQLEELGVDAYKIASFSVTDIPLLEAMAKTKKTVFFSLGMCVNDEIDAAVKIMKNCDLVLLHCISSYPMKAEDANLRLIPWLMKYGYPVGYSDHDVGIDLATVAVALGARCIEKHYTSNRVNPGFDHAFSLEPTGLRKVIRNLRKVHKALKGMDDRREILPCEMKSFTTKRKAIVSTRPIKKGTKITRDMLTTKGPNNGLPPKMIPDIVGKIAMEDIEEDTHLTFSMVQL